jgi:hypothetical protein
MTYGEVKKSVTGLLRGDNSKAEEFLTTDDTYLKMALRDVMLRCIPSHLVSSYDDTKTDVFRRIYSTYNEIDEVYNHWYIREPIVSIDDNAKIDIDEELTQAVIYYMCSYLTNKKNVDYAKQAQSIVSIYQSNSVDFSQYEV